MKKLILQKPLSYFEELQNEAIKSFGPIYKIKEKKKRNESLNKARTEIIDKFNNDDTELHIINNTVKSVEKNLVRFNLKNW